MESKLFYSEVLGGELLHEILGFVEYRIGGVIFGLSEQNQGWTAPDHEDPHYAFYLDGLRDVQKVQIVQAAGSSRSYEVER